jgi:hypothetical protein
MIHAALPSPVPPHAQSGDSSIEVASATASSCAALSARSCGPRHHLLPVRRSRHWSKMRRTVLRWLIEKGRPIGLGRRTSEITERLVRVAARSKGFSSTGDGSSGKRAGVCRHCAPATHAGCAGAVAGVGRPAGRPRRRRRSGGSRRCKTLAAHKFVDGPPIEGFRNLALPVQPIPPRWMRRCQIPIAHGIESFRKGCGCMRMSEIVRQRMTPSRLSA